MPAGDTASMADAPVSVGRRAIVTGQAGSGKSAFSRGLAAKTGLPLVHLDLHFWKPGWTAPPDEEWVAKQREVLGGEAWIADGNYPDTLDLRLAWADTVVVLEMPWWTCSRRALVRGVRTPGSEMPQGCPDSAWRRLQDEWPLALRIWRQRGSVPARERRIIAERGQHVTAHVLRSNDAVARFLADLPEQAS